MTRHVSDDLLDRYAGVYTGAITDVLDDRGHRQQTLEPSLTSLGSGVHVAGYAYPVLGRPNEDIDEEENIRNILTMLGEAPANSVVTYETNATASAQIGELSVECLLEQGARGAVVDGGVRDVEYILDNEFPIFRRFTTPADAVPRWELLEWNTTIHISDVEISPGDVVVGDADGVVVVPSRIAEDVLSEVEALIDTENEVRAAVQDGTKPLAAYERYGVF